MVSSEIDILEKDFKVEKNTRIATQKKLVNTEIVLQKTDSTLQEVALEKLAIENDTIRKSLEINQLKIDTLQKQIELDRQTAENKLQEETIKNKQKTILFLIAFSIVFFIAGLWYCCSIEKFV